MRCHPRLHGPMALTALALRGVTLDRRGQRALTAQGAADEIPTFELDPSWPKPLPNNWAFGEAWGIAVDSRDHPWVLHSTNQKSPAMRELVAKEGKRLAPPVVEFDATGQLVQAWGGPGAGYSWPEGEPWAEHGMFIDYKDNVWVTGDGHVALKFSREGKFLLQIGELWKTAGSNDRRLLGKPTTMAVYRASNEVFIADGYTNQRVIVFDADTGAYKRHWGAYGKPPDDGPTETLNPSRPGAAALEPDALRPDRERRPGVRLRPVPQPVPRLPEGRHVRQGSLRRAGRSGAVRVELRVVQLHHADEAGQRQRLGLDGGVLARSPAAIPLHRLVDELPEIYIYRRSDLQLLGSFDTVGGHHEMAVDSKGNIYTTDGRSRKPLRYLFKGMRPAGR